jgi:hypothetical protein
MYRYIRRMNYRSIDYLMEMNDGINPYGFVHHYKRNYRMNGGVTVKKNGIVVKYSDNTLQNKTKEELKEIFKYNEELKTGYEEGDSDYNAIEEEQTQIIDISGRKTMDEFKEETKNEPDVYKEFKELLRPEYDAIKDFQVKKRLNKFLQDKQENAKIKNYIESEIFKKYDKTTIRKPIIKYINIRIEEQKTNPNKRLTLKEVEKMVTKLTKPVENEFGVETLGIKQD